VTDSHRLEVETRVIQLLIENAAHVGMVSESIIERASLFNVCFTLTGESNNTINARVIKAGKVVKKKKQRSSSLQGVSVILDCMFFGALGLSLLLCEHKIEVDKLLRV